MSENNKDQGHRNVTIYVNTHPHPWDKKDKISFQEVVILAFGNYSEDPNVVYTVNYTKGPDSNFEGSMVKDREVKVKDGMIFNVTQTNKG